MFVTPFGGIVNQSDSGTETNLKCIITVHNNHLYEIFGMSEPSGFETVKQSLDETAKTWKWSSGK